jgi:hypothetical protein
MEKKKIQAKYPEPKVTFLYRFGSGLIKDAEPNLVFFCRFGSG